MKGQSPSNLFVSVLTITIVTYSFATITCVSGAGLNVYVINALNGGETLGVSCGEIKDYAEYNPKGPPQVTLKQGERHQWHLAKPPNTQLACLLTRKGKRRQVAAMTATDPPEYPDRYLAAKDDRIYYADRNLPLNDRGWDPDDYDVNGNRNHYAWPVYRWQ
ncbi:hypothetical protein AgCh_006737 [Apium graveolens]